MNQRVSFFPPHFLLSVYTIMFKRRLVKGRPQLPRQLVPSGSFQTRRAYGTGDPTSEPRANIYIPEGHLVQHTDSYLETEQDIFRALATTIEVEGHYQGKKERQFQRWEGEILPALMEPYMKLLRDTDSLRNMHVTKLAVGCTGCQSGRLLKVSCVFFESMFSSTIGYQSSGFSCHRN